MGTQNTNLSVEQAIKERDFYLTQLQGLLSQQEELIGLVSRQSTPKEQEAFKRLSSMLDRTITQIESTQKYYKMEILKATQKMGNPIEFGL